MSANRSSSHRLSRLLVVGIVLTSGIVLSLAAYYLSALNAQQLLHATLIEQADQRIRAIERRLTEATSGSLAPLSRFRRLGADRRAMFHDMAEFRLSSSEDIMALMWVPRVWPEDLQDHEQEARDEGLSAYRVHGNSGSDFGQTDELLPILYVEPESSNQTTLGLDLATIPEIHDALSNFVDDTGPVMTPPLTWSDDSGHGLAVLVFRAMIRNRHPDDTPEMRREKLVGYAVAVIGLGAMIESSLAPFGPGMDVVLSGSFDGGSLEPVCRYDSVAGRTFAVDARNPLPTTASIELPSRELNARGGTWAARAIPTDDFIVRHRTILPQMTLVVGLLLTGIVSAYLNTVLGRNAKIQRLVVRRTTQLEKANEELSRERFLLTTLLKQSPDYIYFKDARSRFLRVSRALAGYFGFSDASAVVGKTDFDAFPEEMAKQFRADEMRIMETGEPVIDKEEYQDSASGQHFWLSTSKVPLRNEDGEIIGTFGISRDISARKRAEDELAAAKAAAEAANQAKSDFVANMSHEIRTPMNAVIGLTELVLDSELAESQREYLKMVLESGESLLAIINDILDFSKIEAGKLDLDRGPFDLRELIGDTMKSLAFRAHNKGLELACRVAPDVPDRLVGDAGRLRQVIVNLVGNSVKFTDAGEIVLEVDGEHCSEHQVQLHATVRDTGVGIAPTQQPLIFNAFEQVDSSSTRRFGGSGLGLAICDRLVQLMDGRIWVESVPGRGSLFHFTARLSRAPDVRQDAAPDTVSGTRVLVVDDNGTNRRILDETLSNWGMVPTCAPGAAEALELAREACHGGRPFPLVLTDANMPDMDGFDLAERIQSDHQLNSTVVMMLTSGGRPEDVSRCENLDVAAYLLKPAKQSELFDAIVMALGIQSTEDELPADLPGERPTKLPPLRILLAEDSLVNQKLAVGLLEKYGHEVVVAGDGRGAIAAFDSHQFDLVLMDVQMPEMDGFEATAVIRAKQRESSERTPIIAMTAHAMKGDRQRCLKAGMDDYVAKPIRAARLFETMARVLAGDSAEPSELDEQAADTSGIDWKEAVNSVGGDNQLLAEVVAGFQQECPQLLAALRRAVADDDARDIAATAHKLKGTVRFFGATDVFHAAWRLEQAAGDGNLGDTRADMALLEQAVPLLVEAVAATWEQHAPT